MVSTHFIKKIKILLSTPQEYFITNKSLGLIHITEIQGQPWPTHA